MFAFAGVLFVTIIALMFLPAIIMSLLGFVLGEKVRKALAKNTESASGRQARIWITLVCFFGGGFAGFYFFMVKPCYDSGVCTGTPW